MKPVVSNILFFALGVSLTCNAWEIYRIHRLNTILDNNEVQFQQLEARSEKLAKLAEDGKADLMKKSAAVKESWDAVAKDSARTETENQILREQAIIAQERIKDLESRLAKSPQRK